MEYNDLFMAGNKAQNEKLQQYNNKKGYESIDIDYAMERLWDELSELWSYRSVNNPPFSSKKLHKLIRGEAADIANFAHMIILKCDKVLKKLTG